MPKSATVSSPHPFMRFSRRLFQHPAVLLGLMGIFLTLLVLPVPPTLMVSDSLARMHDAHWIWSGENPGGPLPGINGMGHHWYGLGQTLLFILPDFLLAHLGFINEKARSSATALVVFPLLNGCLLALGWFASRHLGFSPRASLLNILILTPCTTLLWHLQNNQENTFILTLAFIAIIGLIR